MSVGEHLFVRGMKSDDNEDMWDDTQLIKAYEKAMKSYKPAEMAKRIAMATNAKSSDNSKQIWRVGSACRAIFEGDGDEYEAYIMEMLDKGECLVRFVGYGDDATVKLKSLKPSHGTAARSEQVYNITTEPSWKEIVKSEFGVEESALDSASEAETLRSAVKREDRGSTAPTSSRHSDTGRHKKNKKHKRKHHTPGHLTAALDPTRLPLDALPMFGDLPGLSCLPPLPPILPPGDLPADEHDILNSMLTSWYMSGYYAGLYQSCLKKKSKKSS